MRGTVEEVRWEPDGDLHILLAVSRSLVNDANVSYEHGDLVLEVICQPVSHITVTGHVYIAPAPAPTTPAPPPPSSASTPAGCYPKTPSGNCYEPGEFCSSAEHGETGVAGDGKTITCENTDPGSTWHWV